MLIGALSVPLACNCSWRAAAFILDAIYMLWATGVYPVIVSCMQVTPSFSLHDSVYAGNQVSSYHPISCSAWGLIDHLEHCKAT